MKQRALYLILFNLKLQNFVLSKEKELPKLKQEPWILFAILSMRNYCKLLHFDLQWGGEGGHKARTWVMLKGHFLKQISDG